MATNQENSKRIAKNTLLLYFRMIFLMVISLYTSRVTLQALGVTDFGLYNVVGGVVAIFSVISGSLNASISRFITYELGTGNKEKLVHVFSSSVTIQIALALIVLILAEPIGLWFMHNKMVIPADRMIACDWIFQFSLLTFCTALISVPYNAAIISHEKMGAFAYITIIDAIMKLGIVFLIQYTSYDRLIFYGFLIALSQLVDQFIYWYYCKRKFEECTYHFIFDKELLKKMFGFAGWNFIGAISAVLRDQGGNIIINLFAGPTVNAARGVAMQINKAVNGFVSNFMTAVNPQITKSYASGDYDYMYKLSFQGSRLSYYMLLLLSLPIIVNIDFILHIWLGTYPDHAPLFAQLVLIFAMSTALSGPLVTMMLATGNIRNYQIVVGGLQMMNLPVSYVCLKIGAMPESVLIVAIIIDQICMCARLYMLHGMIGLKVRDFMKYVYFNVIIVTVCAAILPLTMKNMALLSPWIMFIANSALCVICTIIAEYYIGCTSKERACVLGKIKQAKNKILKK